VRLLGEEKARGSSLEELREDEAEEIAALVLQAKREAWPVHAPTADDPDATRPVRFSDIALLLPTRTTLPFLENALEQAGIPVRVESQSLVFATAEVRELLSILRAVDDPTDGPAIVASLRSPAFGCRDDELARYHQAGGRWDYRRPAPDELPPDHPVVAGMAALAELHGRRWWETVSETVERIIRERRLLELATAHHRPRDHWRRIRFFADMARAFADAGGTSVRAFVDWIDEQIEQEARVVEVVVPEPDDDAMRILTVHGAKGLEFPVVVLTGLNVALQHRAGPVLWSAAGTPQARLGYAASGFQSAGWADAQANDKGADEAERIRLLYVAATRARDHLVVCLHRRENERKCPAVLLATNAETAGAVRMTATAPAADDGTAVAADDDGEATTFAAERDAWVAARAARLSELGRAATVSATALAGHAGLAKEPTEAETPAWRRGRAGTSIGRAVHATLQTIDLADPRDLADTASAQAWAEEIPTLEADVVALVESVLAAPIVRTAATGARHWREVPVAAVVDGVTIEGFVDLLVEGPDGLVVVDYKTDRPPDDRSLDELMAKYRVQGAAYALALERVLGRPVARCAFVFARVGEPAIERDVDDLAAVVAEVASMLPDATMPA
jgi:ATP-dependent exoDNAse (exonuclease V) beta subunit